VGEAALCLRSQSAGDLRRVRGRLAVVGLSGHLGFDARLVAAGAARFTAAGGPEVSAVEATFLDGAGDGALRPFELARRLELEGAAESLGEAVRAVLPRGATVALLPPVLGLDPAAHVHERVALAAGLPVAEALSDPPSVPGARLDAALLRRLLEAGIALMHGEVAPGRGPGTEVRVGETLVKAAAWVLASGRFIGGGLARAGGALREPLLGLPVTASCDGASGFELAGRPPALLTSRERRAEQPLLAAGVAVDGEAQPLGADGRPFHPGLFAAGAIIGGHEHAADGTGLGVAILSGWLAGRGAATAARRAGRG
jgi:glycerol-3-phosphate dehydrogenase subunit B